MHARFKTKLKNYIIHKMIGNLNIFFELSIKFKKKITNFGGAEQTSMIF